MKNRPFCFVIFMALSSCNLSDETKELSGGWLFVSESKTDKVIDGGYAFIPCEVTHYGYNIDFIIAAQKPTRECFLGKDKSDYQFGSDSTYYWIVVHKGKQLIGPLGRIEFENAKDSLKIPSSIKLEPIK
jgi:hypothetical protein